MHLHTAKSNLPKYKIPNYKARKPPKVPLKSTLPENYFFRVVERDKKLCQSPINT
jgi:hypothetical protein